MSEKVALIFSDLSASDQEWFLAETWCDKCSEADLGIKNPELYIENGVKRIKGNCIKCGTESISSIDEIEIDG